MPKVKLVIPSAAKSLERFTKAGSTLYPFRSLIAPDEDATTNNFIAATSSTERTLGVIQTEVASSDLDYTSETKKPILIDHGGIWEFAVGTGTADANDEQGYIDLKDADEVDVTASTIDAVFVTAFISATKVLGKICRWAHLEAPSIS